MVFQEFNLFPHLSVIDNLIEAPVTVKGMPRDQAIAMAEKYLDKVGLMRSAMNIRRACRAGKSSAWRSRAP